jgi:hypothetical protein
MRREQVIGDFLIDTGRNIEGAISRGLLRAQSYAYRLRERFTPAKNLRLPFLVVGSVAAFGLGMAITGRSGIGIGEFLMVGGGIGFGMALERTKRYPND